MGRPLNKKYLGQTNYPDPGMGGQSVASVTITTAGTYQAAPTVSFSAPEFAVLGAETATGTVQLTAIDATVTVGGTGYLVGDTLTFTNGDQTATFTVATVTSGAVATVTVLNGGTFVSPLATGAQATTTSGAGTGATLTIDYGVKDILLTNIGAGYVNVPTLTFTSGTAAATVTLTADRFPSVQTTAITTGSSARTANIIRKQIASHRYLVENQDGTARCTLVANTPTVAGTAAIVATDSAGGTYWVTKLTAHKAVLTPNTGTQFTADSQIPWTLGTPVLNYSVKINNA